MATPVNGHRERMRLRAERMNAESMRPQDLLELLLYYALPRRDTKDQAFGLIERFGSLRGVLEASEAELRTAPGIGAGTAKWLSELGELARAYGALEAADRPRINNIQRSARFLRSFFQETTYPEVWQLCLNAGGRLLSGCIISENASWGESEYLRAALANAMQTRAHSVVIGQFSPVEHANFEEYDERSTQGYALTLSAAGIELLDHVLICPTGSRSMFATGKLDSVRTLVKANLLRDGYLMEEEDFDGNLFD